MPIHSGATDILAVTSAGAGDDGGGGAPHLASTPFVVCFGMGKVTRPAGRVLSIYVNDKLTPLTMTLGGDGYAVFPRDGSSSSSAAPAADASPSGSPLFAPATTADEAKPAADDDDDDGGDAEAEGATGMSAVDIAAEQHRILAGEGGDVKVVQDWAAGEPTRGRLPTSAQLASLGLVEGKNTVVFQTKSMLHGTVSVAARIFLVPVSTAVVVSDIDGTVTRSDVRGHVYAKLGIDWTHSGLCELYSRLAHAPPKSAPASPKSPDGAFAAENVAAEPRRIVVYLTARSLGQVDGTRAFLSGIVQHGVAPPPAGEGAAGAPAAVAATLSAEALAAAHGTWTLPDGPVFTAPEGLLSALKHELAKQAHTQKMASLVNVQRAYRDVAAATANGRVLQNPLCAGFGNRMGDVKAYTAVGIAPARQFMVNPASVYAVATHPGHTFTFAEVIRDIATFMRPIVVARK